MTKVPKLSKQAEEAVIEQAFGILSKRVHRARTLMSEPVVVNDYLRLKLSQLESEVFGVLFLDMRNKLIEDRVMFQGTLNQSAVFPREVVKLGLKLNASAVFLYHNHPSGYVTPSPADMLLTKNLKRILSSVDILLQDHIIVAGLNVFSFRAGDLL